MATITIAKTRYEELKKKASAYERIFGILADDLFAPPSVRSAANYWRISSNWKVP